MPESKKLIVSLLLGILIGVALISSMGISFSSSTSIPSGHQSVIDKITITSSESSLVPICISSGQTQALSTIPLFAASGSVKCSIWSYQSSATDLTTGYAFVTVFGPDSSGNTYWVEVSRATPTTLTVTYPTGTTTLQSTTKEGYIYFEVIT